MLPMQIRMKSFYKRDKTANAVVPCDCLTVYKQYVVQPNKTEMEGEFC